MLPIDVTFDTGEEIERGRRQKTSLKIIIVVKYDIVEVQRTSQEIILKFKRQVFLNIALRVRHF